MSESFLRDYSQQAWGSESIPKDWLVLLEKFEQTENRLFDALKEKKNLRENIQNLEKLLERFYWKIIAKFLKLRLKQAHESFQKLEFGPEKICFDFPFLNKKLANQSESLIQFYHSPRESENILMYVHEWLESYYCDVVKLGDHARLLKDKQNLERDREAIRKEIQLLKERRASLVGLYPDSQKITLLIERVDSLSLSKFFLNEKINLSPNLDDRRQMAVLKGELSELMRARDSLLRLPHLLHQAEEVNLISETVVARVVDFFQARTDVENAENLLKKDEKRRRELSLEQKEKPMLEELKRIAGLIHICAKRAGDSTFVFYTSYVSLLNKVSASRIIDVFEEFDPNIFRSTRVIRLGRPRVLLLPGGGHGLYDGKHNLLVVPCQTNSSLESNMATAFASYRVDLDEEKNLYSALKELKRYRAKKLAKNMYEAFAKDYLVWLLVESQGFKKMTSELRRWFLRHIAPHQDSFKVPVHLRRAMDQAEFPDELMHHYKKQFQDDGQNLDAIFNVAVMLSLRELYDKAVVLFKKILSRKNDMYDALYNLALCYEKQGKTQDAIEAWTAYIRFVKRSYWTVTAQDHLKKLKQR